MTVWKKLKYTHPNLYVMLIVVGVVAVWRGLWGLMDMYLFPSDPEVSFLVSLALGLLLLWLNDFRLDELR